MAQPTPFNRSENYTEYAAAHPGATFPPASLDGEMDDIETTLDGLCLNLALIQRDDGMIANNSVHPDAFTTGTLALIASDWTPRGAWITARAYVVGDLVEESTFSYVCTIAHTSGAFSTDRAAGRWTLVGGATPAPVAADVTFTPTGSLSATNVQAALAEVDGDVTAHVNDTSAAHAASAISFAGAPGMTATDVEAAIDELNAAKAPINNAAHAGTWSVTRANAVGAFGVNGFTASTENGAFAGFVNFHYGTTQPTGHVTYRSRGSFSVAADSQAGDVLGNFAAWGWNLGTWRSAGAIRVEQESYTAAAGYVPSTIRFFNTDYSGADNENFRIWGGGQVSTGGAATATGYGNRGDVTLPAGGGLRAKNTIKAWVMFNGAAATPIPLGSFNVTTITDHGTGDYTINFPNAGVANANYLATLSSNSNASADPTFALENWDNPTRTTTALRIYTVNGTFTPGNRPVVSVGIVGE